MEINYTPADGGLAIIIVTSTACHLTMRWTNIEPKEHDKPSYRRGFPFHSEKYYCFDTYKDNEQEEAGDTLVHTFLKPKWLIRETRWSYFWGTIDGKISPSTTAIFKHYRPPPILYFEPYTPTPMPSLTVLSYETYTITGLPPLERKIMELYSW